MKDKNVAGILALFLGGFGIHRFYLEQSGWGIGHLVFCWNPISWFIGWISAISFFVMSPDTFDLKYNKPLIDRDYRGKETDFDRRRDRRDYREYREDRRTERRQERRARQGNRHRPRSFENPPPHPRPPVPTPPRKKPNPYKTSGIKKYREYDYDDAIIDFIKALEIDPTDIATHFNLACAYSLNEQSTKAFSHLDRAVALGFKDFQKIKEHDALAYLRIQDQFETFEQNGFRIQAKLEPPKNDLLSTTPNLLDQLKKLGELKEKGLLTEKEFTEQKRKLLG